jgi:hypothetical protein
VRIHNLCFNRIVFDNNHIRSVVEQR